MRTAFVTGADGFLGTHLVRRLSADAWRIETLPSDLFSPGAFALAREADVIFHLAGVSYVPDAKADPAKAARINIDGTLLALEAARASRARLVFMSSSHVYGETGPIAVEETHALAPVTFYGATKAAAEAIAWAYKHSRGVPVVAVRAFNIYGPGQRASFVVPEFAARIVREDGPLRMGDPTPVRDFVFVDDAIDLLVASATRPEAAGEAINLASGTGVSIGELGRTMLRVAGSKHDIAPAHDAKRARESNTLVGSRAKAERLLGWRPRVSLEEGLKRTLAAQTGTLA